MTLDLVEKYGVFTVGMAVLVIEEYLKGVTFTKHPEKESVTVSLLDKESGESLLNFECDIENNLVSGNWDDDIIYREDGVPGLLRLSDIMEEEDQATILGNLAYSHAVKFTDTSK